MATVIRMRRGGRTHKPYYRIVVQDTRDRIGGPEIDTLGIYHPCARPEPVTEVDVHKALDWLRKGAQPSDTARSVLRKLGVLKHFNDGTMPDEAVAQAKDEVVVDKGYNPAPEPKEEVPAEAEAPTESEAVAGDEASAATDAAPAESEERSE